MDVHQIKSQKLKADEKSSSLWYQLDGGDLFIQIGPQKVLSFEFTREDDHLEGGHGRALRFGKLKDAIQDEEKDFRVYKGSRLVEFEKEIPQDFLKFCEQFMFQCPNIERSIKDGILKFLISFGQDDSGLITNGVYLSYRVPQDQLAKQLRRKKLKKFLMSLVGLCLFMGPVAIYVNSINQMSTDDLKLACQNGDQGACQSVVMGNLLKFQTDFKLSFEKSGMNDVINATQQCKVDNNCKRLAKKLDKMDRKQLHDLCTHIGINIACEKVFYTSIASHFKMINDPSRSELEKPLVQSLDSGCTLGSKYACQKLELLKETESSRRACLKEPVENCLDYAKNLERVNQKEEALNLYQKMCDQNYFLGCLELAQSSTDKLKRQNLLRKACVHGKIIKACYYLKLTSASDLNEKLSLKYSYRSCVEGNEKSCNKFRQ